MADTNMQQYVPKKLVQTLVYLWIALVNAGLDLGLLMKATRSSGVVVLIVLLTISIVLSIHWTKVLMNMFRECGGDAAEYRHPEIV